MFIFIHIAWSCWNKSLHAYGMCTFVVVSCPHIMHANLLFTIVLHFTQISNWYGSDMSNNLSLRNDAIPCEIAQSLSRYTELRLVFPLDILAPTSART